MCHKASAKAKRRAEKGLQNFRYRLPSVEQRHTLFAKIYLKKGHNIMKESGMMKFVTSFMYILFGLALMLWPRQVENVICTILAVCVIVFGVLKLVSYSITKVESRIMNDTNGFAAGISLVIFGIFLWLKGTIIIALIPFILGFMITYKGLRRHAECHQLQKIRL